MSVFRSLHAWLTLERFDAGVRAWAGSALLLFLRLYVGWQFFASGLEKLRDWNAALALFHQEYHVPVLPPTLAAYVGTFGELTFPALLFVGFGTRAAALGLFAVNAMAVISYPLLFTLDCPAAINDHKYWAIGIATIFCFGGGEVSLDAWLRHRANGGCKAHRWPRVAGTR
ncbi:MAG: DoxX family protein [Proteobacteria bacterium]|nr:DoxX family protein [Pseudomonadota bacterium]